MNIETETLENCRSFNDEYYNSDRILQQWGFDHNHCFNCGKLNSELCGLLMQCGICKKVRARDKYT